MNMFKETEDDIQATCFEFVAMKYYRIKHLFFAIPNGGKRHIKTAVRMKKTGTKSGVPDSFFALPSGAWHGLFVEFKSKKSVLSDNQKIYKTSLSHVGYKVVVVKSVDEFIKEFVSYLNLSKEEV